MRVATIDIGTNTVLLLVAERKPSGEVVPVLERASITRLGQGVDKTRTLADAAVERTLSALRGYADDVRREGAERIAIVGTSAMRDAKGGEQLRASIETLFEVAPEVISGKREAELTFKGALSGLPVRAGDSTLVFDIGGGSTEIVLGRIGEGANGLGFTTSVDVGSVRLTERHVRSNPPSSAELADLRAGVAQAFAALPNDLRAVEPVGIAGTMTTLAAIALGMTEYDAERVHGAVLTVSDLERVATRLAALPLKQRALVPGLEPKRADVIVAGGCIALGLLSRLGAERVRISDRGVRWGLALELAEGGAGVKPQADRNS